MIKSDGQIPSAKEFEALATSAWQAAGFTTLELGGYNKLSSVKRPMISEGIYDVAAGLMKSGQKAHVGMSWCPSTPNYP